MKIVHVASEMAPLIKVGGLGDVVGGLLPSLAKNGLDVSLIIPKYAGIKLDYLKDLKILDDDFQIFEKGENHSNKIYQASYKNIKIFLIEDDHDYFNKDVYGYSDDPIRFIYFSKAAIDFLKKHNEKIDILHLHDWHTALIAPIYKELYAKDKFIKSIVLSIHTMKYQGQCRPYDLDNIGLDGNYFFNNDKLKDPTNEDDLNILKGGLNYSDFIIPVSETYAKEILLDKSEHLHSTIEKNKNKIKGIINGIDEIYWNPRTDKFINKNYTQDDAIEKIIEAKLENKKFIQKILNLNNTNVPIVASIGRLVDQKGPELIKDGLLYTLKKNFQFVLLGGFFDSKNKMEFTDLKNSLKTNKNVSFNFEFNEMLSHQIYAAADFIIIPSLFEPCGLTQMIAFKYGAIPIVRKTGGLADTVFDLDDKTIPKEKKNGFTFMEFTSDALIKTMDRAFKFYKENSKYFNEIVKRNMALDFSWEKISNKYIDVYKKLI